MSCSPAPWRRPKELKFGTGVNIGRTDEQHDSMDDEWLEQVRSEPTSPAKTFREHSRYHYGFRCLDDPADNGRRTPSPTMRRMDLAEPAEVASPLTVRTDGSPQQLTTQTVAAISGSASPPGSPGQRSRTSSRSLSPSRLGRKPTLCEVCRHGDPQRVMLLLSESRGKLDVNAEECLNGDRCLPLIIAVEARNLRLVRLLLDWGADPDLPLTDQSEFGTEPQCTPMTVAASTHDRDVLEMLMEALSRKHKHDSVSLVHGRHSSNATFAKPRD